MSISECTTRFAHALSNPWDSRALGACLPMEPVRPSMKVCQRMRISTTIGTNGGCFVLVSPCSANDHAFAWYSTSTYDRSDSAAFTLSGSATSSTTGVLSAYMSALPFSSSQLWGENNRMSSRIVAVGVKGQYTGAPLYMSGTWNGFLSPDGTCLRTDQGDANNSIPNLSGSPAFKDTPVTKKPMMLATGPFDYEGYSWKNHFEVMTSGGSNGTATASTYPWSTVGTTTNPAYYAGCMPILLMLTGGTAGQGVVFDIIVHIEYSGKLCTALTPSHYDETAARAALTSATAVNQSSAWHPSFQQVVNGLTSVLQMGTQVVRTARTMAPIARAAAPLLLM